MTAALAHLAQAPLDRDQRKRPAKSGFGMASAWLMIGSVTLGIVIGLAIDRALASTPWATLISSLLFLAAGVYLVIRDSGT